MGSNTYNLENSEVRKIVVGKDCYLKYCAECPYKIDAFWEKKEGFKYGWMGIICCMSGGSDIDAGQQICQSGIGWDIKLGRGIDFDPTMLWIKCPPIGPIDGYEDTKVPERRYYDDE
jgi:hypothetical protein